MELQPENIITEQQKEIAIKTMTDANSTAKILKIASTKNQVLKQSGSRTQTANPINYETQFYDIAQEDKVEQLSNDIEMEFEKQSEQVKKGKANMVNLLQAHLEDASPSPMNIAHVIASSSNTASSSDIPAIMEGILSTEPKKRSPEEEHEPKGKVGRPKRTQQSVPEPMLIDKELKRSPEEEHEPKGKVGRPK